MSQKARPPKWPTPSHKLKIGRLSMSGRSLNRWLLATTLLAATAVPAAAQQPPNAAPINTGVKDFKPVTAEMLLKPDPADWLMWRRTYDRWGYSPLDPIHQ